MCDPLGKNLLLSSCFAKDFEEESSTSSLGILWGRIFCLLFGYCLNVLGFIRKKSCASSVGMIFIREESSTSLLGMMLCVF